MHDADANFATIMSLPDVNGPIALDAEKDLLLTVSKKSSLQLYDVRDGEMIADLAVDLSDIGTATDLLYDSGPRSLVVLGDEGMTSMLLTPGAHQNHHHRWPRPRSGLDWPHAAR